MTQNIVELLFMDLGLPREICEYIHYWRRVTFSERVDKYRKVLACSLLIIKPPKKTGWSIERNFRGAVFATWETIGYCNYLTAPKHIQGVQMKLNTLSKEDRVRHIVGESYMLRVSQKQSELVNKYCARTHLRNEIRKDIYSQIDDVYCLLGPIYGAVYARQLHRMLRGDILKMPETTCEYMINNFLINIEVDDVNRRFMGRED